VTPKRLLRKGLPALAAVALLAGALVASAQARPAAPPQPRHTAQPGRAARPAAGPDHVTVLAAALKKMRDHYASFANFTPGPQDIFDYNIGNLWLKGIDGSGTTVAVIEGWTTPASPRTSTSGTCGTACPTRSSRPSTRPARCPRRARRAWWRSAATGRAMPGWASSGWTCSPCT